MGGHERAVPVNNLPVYKKENWGIALVDMHRELKLSFSLTFPASRRRLVDVSRWLWHVLILFQQELAVMVFSNVCAARTVFAGL
jgi:hypothetical protein